MSVHQPLRAPLRQESTREIAAQLSEMRADITELTGSQLTEAELMDLEIENDRHMTIINGYDPDEGYRYDTVEQYDKALERLVWNVTADEQLIIELVCRQIRQDKEWYNFSFGDYYGELAEEAI